MAVILEPAEHAGVDLRPLVQQVLDDVRLCTLSSVNRDGTAYASTAFFCTDSEWRLYFVSRADAVHSGNVAVNPSTAVAVYDSRQDWDDWKTGLQLLGTCTVLEGAEAGAASKLYGQRFPAYPRWLHSVGRAVGSAEVPVFYAFVPKSVKVLHEEILGEETFVTVRLARD